MEIRQIAAAFTLTVIVSLPGIAQTDSGTTRNRSTPPAAGQQASGNANQQSARPAPAENNPLNLTEDQKAKLGPILVEEREQLEELRSEGSLSQQQKIQKAKDIRDDVASKIRAVLTPEQVQKLVELEKQQNGELPNPNPPPAASDNRKK